MLIDAMFENPAHMTELMGIKEVDALVLPEERIDAAQLKTAVDACRAAGKSCFWQAQMAGLSAVLTRQLSSVRGAGRVSESLMRGCMAGIIGPGS